VEKVRRRAAAISRATERGSQVVKQLLTFARKSDIQRRTIEINELILEIARLLEETFPKTIAIRLGLDPTVPPINADPNQLHQVLLNLSLNARDAMPSGGEFVISTRAVSGNELLAKFPAAISQQYIEIRLSDNGMGMDDTTRKQIFDPFFTTKDIGKGTGLGLPVAFGIIERHKGFIDVSSKEGAGSEFRIYLPLADRPGVVDEDVNTDLGAIVGGNETVLFVEDEEEIRETAVEFLEKKGYKVLTAAHGEEAVETFKKHEPDISLILSDLGLPKCSGEEVFHRVRHINPEVPFILLTGFIEPEKKTELLMGGIRHVIHKPYKPAEVLRKIREALGGSTV
jgi:two-component system cell cycle sensor histidine kinase/response regulator CckA